MYLLDLLSQLYKKQDPQPTAVTDPKDQRIKELEEKVADLERTKELAEPIWPRSPEQEAFENKID